MHTATASPSPASASAPPSALRIGALSTAMSLNLVALLGLTLMQATMPPAATRREPPKPLLVDVVRRPPLPPAPLPPMPVAPVRPTPQVQPKPVVMPVPTPVVVEQSVWSEPAAEPAPVPSLETGTPGATASGGGGERATLQYIKAPAPPYPPLARRRGMQGEVVLRVHVGIDGLPIAVEIERGSGHTMLDRQAQEFVLERWTFAPAQVDGKAVEAWGRVPIRFALH